MKILSLLILLIFTIAYAGVSCTPPGDSLNSSSDDDDDDDDDDDRRSTRTCSSRDSCQDICDDMFEYTTERYKCYDLGYEEVNTISKVWDEFSDSTVDSNDLEDLSADDVRAYLDIGMESFIDLVKGEVVGDSTDTAQWDVTTEANSKKVMKWLAEEEDIAEIFLQMDSDLELGLELFQAIGGTDALATAWEIHTGKVVCPVVEATSSTVQYIDHDTGTSCDADKVRLLDLRNFDKVKEFLNGFVEEKDFSGDLFMTFAADERNEKAFEWGHKTLLEFCKEATDEDEDDVDVKTCLQTVYCIYEKEKPGIFEDLEDYEDIVGRTSKRYCASLTEEDRMEDLFE